jgi:hypothetical protein
MSTTDEAVSFGLSTADIAWPVVLTLCVAIMVMPFMFLVLAMLRPDAEEAGDGPPG